MPNDLARLVYYSRNRIDAAPDEMTSQIRQILAASRRNNAPLEVTGALMFNAGCFAQVLEGSSDVLESTFERIQQDPRHGDVSLLAFEPIEARAFPHWSMGFVGARADDAIRYADIAAVSGFDPSRSTGDQVLAALQRLAIEDEALV